MGLSTRLTVCLSALAAFTLVPLTETVPATADPALCKKGQAVVVSDRHVPKYTVTNPTAHGEKYWRVLEDIFARGGRWAPGTCLTATKHIEGWFWKTKPNQDSFEILWVEQKKSFDGEDAHYNDAVWKWFYKSAEDDSHWFDDHDITWVK